MHLQVTLLVEEEIKKMLNIGFIKPIDYLELVSIIVPIGQASGGIRIYTNFRELNKACSKDDFPSPNIDMIVDLTIGHEMLSLMDGFLDITKSGLQKKINIRWNSQLLGEPFTIKVCPLVSRRQEKPIKEK